MQYLKEEIKNRILAAALKEFDEKGFLGSSMRDISSNAGVAIGNVYRYFKNKDELFNAIIEPVYQELISMVFNIGKTTDPNDAMHNIPTRDIVENIMEVFERYGTQLLILINRSKGSKYEKVKEDLILHIDRRLRNELLPKLSGEKVINDELFTYVIASTFVEGVFIILRNSMESERLKELVSHLLILYFKDFIDRFK